MPKAAAPADPSNLYRVTVTGVPGALLAELDAYAPTLARDPAFVGSRFDRSALLLLAVREGMRAWRERYGEPAAATTTPGRVEVGELAAEVGRVVDGALLLVSFIRRPDGQVMALHRRRASGEDCNGVGLPGAACPKCGEALPEYNPSPAKGA